MSKLYKWVTGATATVAGVALMAIAHAQVFTVPTSTASAATADIGTQLADPGTLAILGVAIAIPLVFYVAHQVIGLFPKSRGHRR